HSLNLYLSPTLALPNCTADAAEDAGPSTGRVGDVPDAAGDRIAARVVLRHLAVLPARAALQCAEDRPAVLAGRDRDHDRRADRRVLNSTRMIFRLLSLL